MNLEITRRHFAAMTEEELASVLTSQREEYVPEALALAEAELRSRGGGPRATNLPRATLEPVRKGASFVWADVYPVLLFVEAVGAPVASVLAGRGLAIVAVQIAFGAALVAVAVGLYQRRAWAWWANWFVLALAVAPAALRGPGWMTAAALLNAVYFARRRSSYTRAGDEQS
jgi:hypothetical protein